METRGRVRPVSTMSSRSQADSSGSNNMTTVPRNSERRSPSCNSQGPAEEAGEADRLSGISKSPPVTDKLR